MTFKKKTEKVVVPVGTLKASRMGVIHGYYCTNCNHGMDLKNTIVKGTESCPKCKASLDWNELV